MLFNITGIDGCGKGAQIELLDKFLRQQGFETFISKAYGDAEKECFSAFIEYWDQISIMFAFQAMHTHQRVEAEQALTRRQVVIADRWDESYFAYHTNHGLLKNEPDLRNRLNAIAFNGMTPDVTFFLRVSPETAQKRRQVRGEDFFDRRGETYHRIMAEAYELMAKEQGWIIVDGEPEIRRVHYRIRDHVLHYLNRNPPEQGRLL